MTLYVGSLYSTNYPVAICLLVVVQAEKQNMLFFNTKDFSLLCSLKEEEKHTNAMKAFVFHSSD